MLESLHFSYDGKSSQDMGVMMVNADGGLYKEIFLPSRKIIEKTIPNRHAPYFVRVDDSPLSFPLSIAVFDRPERNSIRSIARWLFTDYYKPLYFESNPHRIFYAMFEGNSTLLHNGLKDSYITLNVRTNSPYTYSPPKTEILDVYGSATREFFNEGDLDIRPKLIITKRGAGSISITNNSTGEELKINDMWDGEIATLDCVNEQITSSYEYNNRYLFDKHNDVWLDWKADSNTQFTFTGNFTVEFIFEYAYLQEYDELSPDGGAPCR